MEIAEAALRLGFSAARPWHGVRGIGAGNLSRLVRCFRCAASRRAGLANVICECVSWWLHYRTSVVGGKRRMRKRRMRRWWLKISSRLSWTRRRKQRPWPGGKRPRLASLILALALSPFLPLFLAGDNRSICGHRSCFFGVRTASKLSTTTTRSVGPACPLPQRCCAPDRGCFSVDQARAPAVA